jgi:anti-anti-sigma regulatory factor
MDASTVHDAPDSRIGPEVALPAWRPAAAMTIQHASTLWTDARSHFADGGSMHIDLSAVERLDTAGCQLLLACREDARRRSLGWRLTGCAPQALEVMRLLGCVDMLEAIEAIEPIEAITEETEQ